MIDEPIINFLCEERQKGNIGYLPSEVLRKSIDHSRNGHWQKTLRSFVFRGWVDRGIELNLRRGFLYKVSDRIYKKWLKQQAKK